MVPQPGEVQWRSLPVCGAARIGSPAFALYESSGGAGPPKTMSLEPGKEIGAYEVTGHLGTGGMGEVYRARDTKLDQGDLHYSATPDRRRFLMVTEESATTLHMVLNWFGDVERATAGAP